MANVYVKRDASGNITDIYGSHQIGEELEVIDSEDADVLARRTPIETYVEKRLKSIAEGGYGTANEQFEIMNEQGFSAWQSHCATVKSNKPRP